MAVFMGGFVMSALQSQVVFAQVISDGVVTTGPTQNVAAAFPARSVSGYFVHNTSIMIAMWLMGFSIIGPFYILHQNAMNISNYVWNGIQTGDVAALAFIVPHGFFEIPAIIISGGLGLFMASLSFDVLTNDRNVSLVEGMKITVPYVVFVIVLLAIAAVIEATFSPVFAVWVEAAVAA